MTSYLKRVQTMRARLVIRSRYRQKVMTPAWAKPLRAKDLALSLDRLLARLLGLLVYTDLFTSRSISSTISLVGVLMVGASTVDEF